MQIRALFATTALLLCHTGIATAATAQVLTAEQAREELELVVSAIHEHHPNPFHATSRSGFEAEVTALRERSGPIPASRQYYDLMKIASLVSDTHTQLHITDATPGFNASYPLRFRLFPDGLYIIAGDESYREAIGKKVTRIGGRSTDDVIERLACHSAADNWPRKKTFAETFLYLPETYRYLGLADANGRTRLELVDMAGEPSSMILDHTWDRGYTDFSWDSQNPFIPEELIDVHEALGGARPFYLQNLSNNYWYRFLDEDRRYMYLQINQQFDKQDGQAAVEFHLEWARELLDSPTEVVIIDLRNDPGGTVNVANPISALLSEIYFGHPKLRGVAVLFGTDTVSAGTIIIGQLEDTIRPILIGAPSGSSPNMYLNADKQVLPHSGLQFEVSMDVYVSTREADRRAYIAPDIARALSFDDYLHGRDHLLDFAKTVNKDLRRKIYDSASPYDPWQRDTQQEALQAGTPTTNHCTGSDDQKHPVPAT